MQTSSNSLKPVFKSSASTTGVQTSQLIMNLQTNSLLHLAINIKISGKQLPAAEVKHWNIRTHLNSYSKLAELNRKRKKTTIDTPP